MPPTRADLRFLLNDRDVTVRAVRSDATLLDFLRLERSLRGTKEGCAEGDCGACTVLVGRVRGGALVYAAVNACIRLMGSLDGCHVVTIEHLRGEGGGLHPIQRAMVENHASQCGFCTPGVVMALYALWMDTPAPSVAAVETALQGNLCRCTGYAPILRAAQAIAGDPARDPLVAGRAAVTARLRALGDGARVEIATGEDRLIVPASVDDLADVRARHPEATIVAGATDVGLWVTKFLRPIAPAIFIGHLDDLRRIEALPDGLRVGACVTYADFAAVLAAHFPRLTDYWHRIGGAQVRNMGTIGGNVANGSPIGDTPPVLIALGATLTLRRGATRRTLAVEDFFIDYGRQDREAGDFVESLFIPFAPRDQPFAAYKVSKRRDEDISAVCAAFRLRIADGRIAEARLAYGGMAATPRRARGAEAALTGAAWDAAALARAEAAVATDFAPIGDWRASADYRARVARNLLRRFWLETTGTGAPAMLTGAGS